MEKGKTKIMNYQPVIGLEVHVELNTKTKMFCRCGADYFGKEPNSQTCPVCLGLPGALPYINQEAIDSCIKIGLALGCSINPISYFERKNYFYPDLAKGFQISQLVLPVAVRGKIEVEGDDDKKITVRINRAHQEEDTGKLMHVGGSALGVGESSTSHEPRATTLIDFNRSGVPLVEIVTEPDFTDSSQVRDYAKKLQQIFRYLGVSNADMERGDMRLEANVSVRKVQGDEVLDSALLHSNKNSSSSEERVEKYITKEELPPYRVELKNINSFRLMVAAIEFEIKRQIEALEKGEKLHQETRGWNEEKRETYLQRSKEEAHDYRYFPEPDLPEMHLEEERVKVLGESIPELPWIKAKMLVKEYGIKESDAKILTESIEFAEFFDELLELGKKEGIDPTNLANYVINNRIDLINESIKQIIDDIKAKKANLIEDEEELRKIAEEVIKEDERSVTAYKSGKENAIMVLIGGVMKKTQGKANAPKVKTILENLLKE